MEAKSSDEHEPDERLYSVLLDYLESAERGVLRDRAAILAQHPELAPELAEFLDTWLRVEHLTEPVRSASQVLQQASLSGHVQDTGGNAGDTALPATRVPVVIEQPEPISVGRPRELGQEEGGWLGKWLRAHPPLVATDYPFLVAAKRLEEIGRLGHFRLLEVIGRGGMGIVFRGEDLSLQRPVAIKVLRAELAADLRFRERFLREARSAASVNHEHVISVYHVGEEHGIPFLCMQWLRGISLEDLLQRAGQLSVAAVARLGRQTALGLAAAHAQGLLHRDIKPANLWIELSEPGSVPPGAEETAACSGRVKILDFGLVRAISDEGHLTVIGTTIGTPAYMAPEQATGASIDARCDLFSLGVVLYRMCTGRLPFPVRHQPAVTGSLAIESPVAVRDLNPSVPAALADLITSLLIRDPAGRPASATEVAEQLRSLEGGQVAPGPDKQPLTPEPLENSIPRPSDRRHPRPWRLIGLAALIALLPLTYLLGGMVVRFATNQGEVVVAVDDPDTEVTVSEGGAVILDRKGQRRITLGAGEHELQVTVKDASGELRFPFKKTIVLTRGGKEIVNVREELTKVARDPSAGSSDRTNHPAAVGSAERPAAEWVLSLGGKVKLRTTNGEQIVQTPTELPAGDFEILGIDLSRTGARDLGLAKLQALADLRDLNLRDTQVGDAGLELLAALKNLQRLNLDNTRVGDNGLARVAVLTKLQNLSLAGTKVTDSGLRHLRALTDLRDLGLFSTRIGDAGLAQIEGLTALRNLDLNASGVGDAGLARLGALQNLQSLNLVNTRVTDAGLSHVALLTNLQHLYLAGAKVTDKGMAHVARIQRLDSLDLTQTPVGDAGLAALAGIKNLQYLGLARTQVTDAGLVHVPELKELRGLDLADTRLTDAGLAPLAGLTKLRDLRLPGTRVTDAGLQNLAGLAGLQLLDLGRTPVTDAGLVHLGAMKHLSRLFLNRTRITDAGVAQVLNLPLPPLTLLDISGSRVSATAAVAVKGILPKAQLEWWEPNRRAAEAILAIGGSVHVRTGVRGSDGPVKQVAALPADYFRLTRAGLTGVQKPLRDVLLLLAALTDGEFDDLEEVDLSGSAVSDADLETLGGLPCRRLILDRTVLYGPGLVHLKNLPRLTDLRLGCPTLSFLGVRFVGELNKLERLSLAGSGATDASLKTLNDLVKLRELDLTGTKVTAEGVALLRKALPKCNIKVAPAGQQ